MILHTNTLCNEKRLGRRVAPATSQIVIFSKKCCCLSRKHKHTGKIHTGEGIQAASCRKAPILPKTTSLKSMIRAKRRTSNDIQGADDEFTLRFGVYWLPSCSGHPPCQLLSHNADAPFKHGLGKLLKGVTCARTHSLLQPWPWVWGEGCTASLAEGPNKNMESALA